MPMSEEKAIETLRWRKQCVDERIVDSAVSLAMLALRKQIPVQPIKDYMGGGVRHYMCGSCGSDMIEGQKYCATCGKAAKW